MILRHLRAKAFVKILVLFSLLGIALPAFVSGPSASAQQMDVDASTGPAMRAVSTTTTDDLVSSLSIASPSGVRAGDVLLAVVDVRIPFFVDLNAPEGWELVRRDTNETTGASLSQAVYYRVAQASEPPSHTWRWSFLPASAAGGIVAYSGIDTERPIEAHSGRYSNDVVSFAAPSVTTSAAGAPVVGFFGSNGHRGISTPDGMTELFDATSSRVGTASAELVQAAAGPTGDKLAADEASAPNSSNIGQLIALRPALEQQAPSPPPPPPPPPPPANLGSALANPLPASPGAVYYVSPSGSDSNPGTLALPWKTIQKAVDTLTAGETALVRGGTYAANVYVERSGTGTGPITLASYPGERPVLRPAIGSGNEMPVEIYRASYFRLRGFVIEGATGSSTTNVYVESTSHHIEISDCEIRGSAYQGIFIDPEASKVQVLRNVIHDNGDGDQPNLEHGIYVEGSNHLIAGNVVRDQRHGFGIQVYPSAEGVIITNNTVIGNRSGGIIVGGEDLTANRTRLVNNIVAFNDRYGIRSYWGGPIGIGNVAINNLAYGNPSGDLGGDAGLGIAFLQNIVADPLFVDRGAADLRLRAGSPALGKADPAYALPTDVTGAARGATPNLGAY